MGARGGEAGTGKCDSVPCIIPVPRESHSYACKQNGSQWHCSNNNLEVGNSAGNGKSHCGMDVSETCCAGLGPLAGKECAKLVLCISLVVWLPGPLRAQKKVRADPWCATSAEKRQKLH